MRNSKSFFLGFLFVLLMMGVSAPSFAQTLFQNNNTSCEDDPVAGDSFLSFLGVNGPGWAQSIDCGRFNDDTAFGNENFPDCASVRDPLPATGSAVDTYTILTNTGEHNPNNCFNLGGTSQFTPQDLTNATLAQDPTPDPTPVPIRLGTIASGNLDGGGFDDLIHPWVFDPQDTFGDPSMQQLFSDAGGGFSSGDTLGVDIPPFVPITNRIIPMPAMSLLLGGFPVGFSNYADRSTLLFDCDDDGVDDAAFGATRSNTFPGLMILRNSGSGLLTGVPGVDFYDLEDDFTDDTVFSVSLTDGDFDGDGDADLVALVSAFEDDPAIVFISLCINDGSCGFDCPTLPGDPQRRDLTDSCPNDCVYINTSITSGDYDGDGLRDVAFPELRLEEILVTPNPATDVRYLTNNGGVITTWDEITVPMSTSDLDIPINIATGQFSTFAIQNNIDETVLTLNHATGMVPDAPTVEVITSDGQESVNAPLSLGFSPSDSQIATGVQAEDFDHCGGDDIIALNVDVEVLQPTPGPSISLASLFLNTNEPPEVNITQVLPGQVAVNIPFDIMATCTDPTFDDRIFDWTVVSEPSAGSVTFGTPTGTLTGAEEDASTTFLASAAGEYTIEVQCADFCGLTDTDQDRTRITFEVVVAFTQGACIASLNPQNPDKGNPMVWLIFLAVPAILILIRWGRKVTLIFMLVLGFFLGGMGTSQALTPSFSVNIFEPTVDDSEYFTVYGSPTMLKRNYHLGVFIDYAHDPYEFGNNNFNRVGGIVDHLLTANVLGSYAILDWFTVGLVVPVYIYEGIRSPLLGLDENNFALGDVKLVLKFRLLDREKHGVGIAIVPFLGIPSSTNSTDFLGDGRISGGGKIVIDGRIKDRVSIALNVGYNARNQITDVGGNNLDDQFLASLGISIDILKNMLKVILEGQMATVTKNFFTDRRTTPAEGRLGFRYTWANNHDVNLGGGVGVSNGIGNPQYRLFAGYTYTKRPIADVVVPPPPMSEIQVGDELTLKDKIYFEFDKAKIREISKPTLDKIAGFLKAHPEVTKIKIDGYTCDLGTDSYNMRLSQRRAKSVEKYLEGQGISPDRIGTVQGYGEADPLVPNTDEANREQNRRVQIFVEAVDPSLVASPPQP